MLKLCVFTEEAGLMERHMNTVILYVATFEQLHTRYDLANYYQRGIYAKWCQWQSSNVRFSITEILDISPIFTKEKP